MLIVFNINGNLKYEHIISPITSNNIIDIITRYMTQINHIFINIMFAGKKFTKRFAQPTYGDDRHFCHGIRKKS